MLHYKFKNAPYPLLLPVSILSIITLLLTCSGCKKLLTVNAPTTSLNTANVYSSDATSIAVLTAIYTNISNSSILQGGLTSMSLFPGLSADEFSLYAGANNQNLTAYYTNTLSNNNTGGTDFWNNIYPIIYNANAAIQGLTGNTSLTPAVDQQLLGEAKFIRALCYFYLTNLYGDVPLVTTIDYKANEQIARTDQKTVWNQVTTDLISAQQELSTNFLDGTLLAVTDERVRPTSWAATALLARTYLYRQVWDSAEIEASLLINNNGLFSLAGLYSVFLANNNEAIWQLQPVAGGQNTPDAQVFIVPATGPSSFRPISLSPSLLNSFETGDQRKIAWVDSVQALGTTYYFPFKYKIDSIGAPVTEYETVFRLGEQFLIRAEAKAEQGNITGGNGALADINVIRYRAGLSNYSGLQDPGSVLGAILHERRVELFSEWGHRWLDLKRTNSIDSVMGSPVNAASAKNGSWSSYKQLYPISLVELQTDPAITQNNGY